MMNSACLHVGLQGLGHQEISTRNALAYAFERVQMKAPMAAQPAMRHTLPLQALTEAQCVIACRAALPLGAASV